MTLIISVCLVAFVIGIFSVGTLNSDFPAARYCFKEMGPIPAGGFLNQTICVNNSGSDAVKLSFFTENWEPTHICDKIKISWDYNGNALNPDCNITIKLSLFDSSYEGIERVSFDLLVIASIC
jgi:hypothetical protein